MIRTHQTLGRSDESRCSICRHPDREAIDQDLVLKQVTQAEAARRVGVHRSTVSRHVKNHVRPALVQGVLMETKDVAIGSIAEAFDRNYARSQVLYEGAVESGDLRLAATLLDHQRRVLEIIVRYASKMDQSTLQDVIAKDPEAEREHYEGLKQELLKKLDDLSERHKRGIVRNGPAATGESGDATLDDDPDDWRGRFA